MNLPSCPDQQLSRRLCAISPLAEASRMDGSQQEVPQPGGVADGGPVDAIVAENALIEGSRDARVTCQGTANPEIDEPDARIAECRFGNRAARITGRNSTARTGGRPRAPRCRYLSTLSYSAALKYSDA